MATGKTENIDCFYDCDNEFTLSQASDRRTETQVTFFLRLLPDLVFRRRKMSALNARSSSVIGLSTPPSRTYIRPIMTKGDAKDANEAESLEAAQQRADMATKKLEAVLKQHKLQVEMLTGKLEDMKSKYEDKLKETKKPNEDGKDDAGPKLNGSESKLADMEKELELVRKQVEDLVAEKSELENKLAAASDEKKALQKSVAAAQGQLEGATAAKEEAERRVEQLLKEIAENKKKTEPGEEGKKEEGKQEEEEEAAKQETGTSEEKEGEGGGEKETTEGEQKPDDEGGDGGAAGEAKTAGQVEGTVGEEQRKKLAELEGKLSEALRKMEEIKAQAWEDMKKKAAELEDSQKSHEALKEKNDKLAADLKVANRKARRKSKAKKVEEPADVAILKGMVKGLKTDLARERKRRKDLEDKLSKRSRATNKGPSACM
eukprot:jgi/Bigna1/88088/estExt_fgenesh1_pg.C_280029